MVQWDGMDSRDCVGGGTLGIIPSHPRWYNGTGWTVETVLGWYTWDNPVPSQMVQWDGMDSRDCVGGGTLGIIPPHPIPSHPRVDSYLSGVGGGGEGVV